LSAPILQVWSAPKCQSDAQPIAALPSVTSAQITETINGTDSGTIRVPADVARAAGIAEGRIIRAIVPLRGVVEWVITSVADSTSGTTVSVTLGPVRQLLALRGFVREQTGTAVSLSFAPSAMTVTDLLTRYVLTNLAEDGLAWLSLGTIEYTDTIDTGSFSAIRRGGLLALIEKTTGYEVQLRRLDNDAGYAIDVLERRGADLPTLLMEAPATATAISRIRDLAQTATAVVPVGTDGKVLGEVDWVGGAASGTGPFYIPLTDPAGGAPPIREDDQFAGAFLRLADGSVLAVTGSRASDSAVRVDAVGSYVSGQSVILCETTAGRPISVIASPSALADARGLIVAKVTARGSRQERTLTPNAGFETGATSWTEVNSSGPVVGIARDELGRTLAMAANGTRGAGTATATPFSVKSLPPSTWIRRGDSLVVSGQTYTITADAIPTTGGALTLSISPVLVGSLSNGNPVTLVRKEQRTLTADGAQSAASPILVFTDSNTDNLPLADGTLSIPATGPGGAVTGTTTAARARYTKNRAAGVLFVDVSIGGDAYAAPTDGWSTLSASGVTSLTNPQQLGELINNGRIRFFADHAANGVVVGSVIVAPYAHTITGQIERVIGAWPYTVTAVTTDGANEWCAVSPSTLGGRVTATIGSGPFMTNAATTLPYLLSNTTIATAASATLTHTRETRELLASGTQSAGTASLVFQADPVIARRDWTSADTLEVGRSLNDAAIQITSGTIAFISGVGYEITCTINLAGSTVQSLPTSDYTGANAGRAVYQVRTSSFSTLYAMSLYSISGTTLKFRSTAALNTGWTIPAQTRTGSWVAYYSHTITGSASWAATGRVTLAISATPTGVTYARGDRVWANWHTRAVHGDSTLLRTHAAVSSGATSIQLYGNDRWASGDDATVSQPCTLYRVAATHSTIPRPGETVIAAADAQANGSGIAAVTLTAVNANAITADVPVTLTRPVLLGPQDRTDGSVLRLLSAPGSATPSISIGAVQSGPVWVPVAAGEAVTVTAVARFRVTAESLAVGQAPLVAIVNLTTNTVLARGTITATTVYEAPYGEVQCVATATITAGASLALRLYGGSSSSVGRWHVCTDASLYVGTDVLPYAAGARSRVGFQRGQDVLAQRKTSARYVVRGVDTATLDATGTPVQIGQRVRLRAASLDLDTTERIVALTWRWPGAELVEMECAALTPRLTDVEVST
jgi:hypothetical protein